MANARLLLIVSLLACMILLETSRSDAAVGAPAPTGSAADVLLKPVQAAADALREFNKNKMHDQENQEEEAPAVTRPGAGTDTSKGEQDDLTFDEEVERELTVLGH